MSAESIMKAVEAMSDEELAREWRAMSGRWAPEKTSRWLMRLGVKYHKIIGEMRMEGKKPSEVMARRYQMAKALDTAGLKKDSDFLTPMYDMNEKENTMGKKTGSKEKKEARVTASSILIKMLGMAKVQDDESIIKEVRSETGSSLFDAKQLAWYKWKYRQGKLKGMDGKQHVINQGSPKKEAKPAKKEKKKIIVKDHRADKEPA